LAAIAVIRTFLNYFLERDIEKYAGLAADENLGGEQAQTGNVG
jgi:hypothetical protein